MQSAPATPALRPRLLAPRYTAQAVSIAGDGIDPVTVTRGSRAAVALNGQIVAAGGYPAPIQRGGPNFAVIPHAGPPPYQQPVANVVVGVISNPNNARARSRRK